MAQIDEIKSRVDIAELISETVKLTRSGRIFTGFCPFHHNIHTSSFRVFPDTQSWYCFGECGEGGDVFDFVMKSDGLTFRQALEVLAKRAGIELQELSAQELERQKRQDRIYELLENATLFYSECLSLSDFNIAHSYLKNRGILHSTIIAFNLGYAPASGFAVQEYLQEKGYSHADIAAAGLIVFDNNKSYDRFVNRLMIPIKDVQGRVVGFGARALRPDQSPKYLNSATTLVFSKSTILYGLDKAKTALRSSPAVVVEGYFDVISAHQAGYKNVVAQMGTALTDQQFKLLSSLTKEVVLALDGDKAGSDAILRGLDTALRTVDSVERTTFDIKGALNTERFFNIALYVMVLPPGLDPDNIISRDADAWNKLPRVPILSYVIKRVVGDADLSSARAKRAVAEKLLPVIYAIDSTIEREHYLKELAQALDTAYETVIRDQDWRGVSVKPVPVDISLQPHSTEPVLKIGDKRRAIFLGTCIKYPWLLRDVASLLYQHGLQPISPNEFINLDDIEIFSHLQAINMVMDEPEAPDLGECLELDQKLRAAALVALGRGEGIGTAEGLTLLVLAWRKEMVQNTLKQLGEVLSGLDEDNLLVEYEEQLLQLPDLLNRLNSVSRSLQIKV